MAARGVASSTHNGIRLPPRFRFQCHCFAITHLEQFIAPVNSVQVREIVNADTMKVTFTSVSYTKETAIELTSEQSDKLWWPSTAIFPGFC